MRQFPLNITVQDLKVAYNNGHVALSDINCTVQGGTITALVGPNGGGKSSLFKAIMGFLHPRQGTIQVGNFPVKQAQKRQLLAYVPQSDAVDWQFPVSVEDVVMMGRYGYMNFLRIPCQRDRQIVQESLERVGLADLRRRQIGELSGGQKKRAFLARALAQQSPVILLDEPFTGVDMTTEATMVELLTALRSAGHTILISSHDLPSLASFGDRTILLNRTVIAQGPTKKVLTAENLVLTFGGLPLNSLGHGGNLEIFGNNPPWRSVA